MLEWGTFRHHSGYQMCFCLPHPSQAEVGRGEEGGSLHQFHLQSRYSEAIEVSTGWVKAVRTGEEPGLACAEPCLGPPWPGPPFPYF